MFKQRLNLRNVIVIAICLAGMTMFSCTKDTEKTVTFTVTFNSNGGSAVTAQTVNVGEKATKPEDPTKHEGTIGLYFLDWYTPDATTVFDFDTPITNDTTLMAQWSNPLGTWKNIGDVGGWGWECTLILTETEWNEDGHIFYISSWTACSNGDAASKDDYPKGYLVKISDAIDAYVYMHKTDPNKMLIFYETDGNYNNYNIFTKQN